MTDAEQPQSLETKEFSYEDPPVKELTERQKKRKVVGYWISVFLVPACLAFELASLGSQWFEWRLNDKVVVKGALLQFTDQNEEGQNQLQNLPQQINSYEYGVPSIPKKSYFDAYWDGKCFDQSRWQQSLDCLMFRNLHLSGVFYLCFGIFVCTGCCIWWLTLIGIRTHCLSKRFKLLLRFCAKFFPIALSIWQVVGYIIWASLNLPNSTCDNPKSDWKDWYNGGDCISFGNTCFGPGPILGLISLLLIVISGCCSFTFGYYEGYGTKELLKERMDQSHKGSLKKSKK